MNLDDAAQDTARDTAEDINQDVAHAEIQDAALWEREVSEDDVEVELPPLRQALEAVLLVADSPVAEVDLAQVLEFPTEVVAGELRRLAEEYATDGRGFELRSVAGGWRLYTAPECAPYVERFVRDGRSSKLSPAALETLAIVAYRQPISRGRISAVRGVDVDGVMRTLLTRGLIEEAGSDTTSGATLYSTTAFFLERLGLSSLEELPPLAPHLADVAGVEEQLEHLHR